MKTGNYRQGPHRYLYRDRLLRMHRRISGDDNNLGLIDSNGSKLDIDLAHVGEYDAALLGLLLSSPAKVLPAMELAAEDALKSLLYDIQRNTATNEDDPIQGPDAAAATSENADGETQPQRDNAMNGITHIQILLKGNLALTPLRSIKAQHMNRLIKCPGIILSASPPRSRATQLLVRCSRCLDTQILSASENDGSIPLPRRCGGDDAQQCGNFPYSVVPDESHFCDRQSLKLQESPETIPTGEMPRSVQMSVERSLVDKAPPGTRVQVLCIPSLYNAAASGTDSVKSVYLKVVGLSRDLTHGESATFSPREEEAFRLLSKRSDVYDILSRSVAPSISGSYTVDIKKAIVAMLFGGTRKRLPDGVRLRGDINVLLLGDPSTAKSQFLKFTSKVAPVGIYTSGKGSSAAGLTASVVKDARGEFYLEGGAMVLADGGIVAIDEFDKMRPQDRVAIHEAMEQQTISVAKAGITTVLNSRSSVLAAANPVFGRYDDLKSASENIDLMTTILSRFDLIFLVRDVREEDRDRMICKHVMGVHIQNSRGDGGFTNRRNLQSRELEEDDPLERYVCILLWVMCCVLYVYETNTILPTPPHSHSNTGGSLAANSSEAIAENIMRVATTGVGELDIPAMKKYVQYCKTRCAPRLSEQAGDVLASSYVKIRDDVRKRSIDVSIVGWLHTYRGKNVYLIICTFFFYTLFSLKYYSNLERVEETMIRKVSFPLRFVNWKLSFVFQNRLPR